MAKRNEIPGYRSWTSMLSRCRNRNRHNANRYAARNITVCDRWLSFENFLEDMGERPDGLTLDRIDNDKGYSPENCRWADALTQTRNRNPYSRTGCVLGASKGRKDRSGEKYSALLLVRFSHSDGKRSYWTALCDCGSSTIVDVRDVVRGHKKSCGCSQFKRDIDPATGRWVAR